VDGVRATVNGIAAPLIYVSPTQINLQIPYEAGSGQAVLGINNNGQIAGFLFPIAAVAPAVFVDANGNAAPVSTVNRGGTITLYMEGTGEVSPQFFTGDAPTVAEAGLFAPALPVAVTVGGAQVFVVAIKLTPNEFGNMQVTLLVPQYVPAGVQPVVVTVGGVSSTPVNITVQ